MQLLWSHHIYVSLASSLLHLYFKCRRAEDFLPPPQFLMSTLDRSHCLICSIFSAFEQELIPSSLNS